MKISVVFLCIFHMIFSQQGTMPKFSTEKGIVEKKLEITNTNI